MNNTHYKKSKGRKGNDQKRNGKKPFRGQYDAKLDREDKEADKKILETGNSPEWYAANPQIIRDYANFTMGTPLGSALPTTCGLEYVSAAIPGIMNFGLAPTWGEASDQNSPINVASNNIYTFVRHANSGSKNYDAPDLMLYIMAMDSAYTYLEWMKRVVRIALDYSVYNRYYPMALFNAMGVDGDDVNANINNFRGFINTFAVKLGSMCVPNSMALTARHMWLNANLFTDGATTKAQTYMFNNRWYLQFGLSSGTAPVGQLNYVAAPGTTTKAKVADLISFANALIAPILSNEDMNIMSGDILKAFGADGVVKIAGITEGEAVLPLYSKEVLSQIENATIYNGVVSGGVTQNTDIGGGYLITDFKVTEFVPNTQAFPEAALTAMQNAINSNRTQKKINFHWDAPTVDDMVVATRLTSIPYVANVTAGTSTSAGTLQFTPQGFTSEVIVNCTMYYFSRSSNNAVDLYELSLSAFKIMAIKNANNTPSWFAAQATSLTNAAQFDWAPDVALLWASATGETAFTNLTFQDTDMYTVVSVDNLRNMSMAAMLSLLYVPQMGKASLKIQ